MGEGGDGLMWEGRFNAGEVLFLIWPALDSKQCTVQDHRTIGRAFSSP
jgi:hypothetical protein